MKDKPINKLEYLQQTSGNSINLSMKQVDALCELGNMAAAHAATNLSKLLGKQIFIDITSSNLCMVEGLPVVLGDVDDRVATVYLDMKGGDQGIILFIFPIEKAMRLSNTLLNRDKGVNREIDEYDRSALCEIGNICACSYLNTISKFLDITMIPSPPGFAVDMLGAILQFPASIIGERSDYAIVIETKMTEGKEMFPGVILFLPDKRSQNLILDKFGLNRI